MADGPVRRAIRAFLPEHWRRRLHPFPSLRQPDIEYPARWKDPGAAGPVLVLAHRPGAAILACGGALYRCRQKGVPVAVRVVEGGPIAANELNRAVVAASELEIDDYATLPPERLESCLEAHSPALLLLPQLSGPARTPESDRLTDLVARAIARRAVRRPLKSVALFEAGGPAVANAVMLLTDDEATRKRWAVELLRPDDDCTAWVDDIGAHRAFLAAFTTGIAEAFLRMTPREYVRLAPLLTKGASHLDVPRAAPRVRE